MTNLLSDLQIKNGGSNTVDKIVEKFQFLGKKLVFNEFESC